MSTTNADILGMSDEDFMKASPSSFTSEEQSSLDSTTEEDAVVEPDVEAPSTEEGEVEEVTDAGEVEDEVVETEEEDSVTQATDSTEKTEKLPSDSQGNSDREEFFKRITAPFKANGKEIQVDNPDDVIQLMQMGANYSKKMAALKPALKTLKVLEKHGLVDEEKLGYLIDLHNKNPQAISKLLKDSGIDPLDINTDEASSYQPTSYKVDDAEYVMDEVLSQIKDSPSYTKTLNLVSKEWDDASRRTVATNPQLLVVINEHFSNGIYERVWSEVERERTFGRLVGMSDLEAYKTVGDKMFSAEAPKRVVARSKAPETDTTRNKKKQAASPSKSTSSPAPDKAEFNPLAISDEEFMKIAKSKYA